MENANQDLYKKSRNPTTAKKWVMALLDHNFISCRGKSGLTVCPIIHALNSEQKYVH